MFKGIGSLASLMKTAQQMGVQMQEIKQQLQGRRVTGSAGAGMVEIEANGLGEILKAKIDPALIDRGDREMIEDLLPAAINQAREKAAQLHREAMQSLGAGLNVPGLNEALAQLGGDLSDNDS